jgi:hypothetical protein
MSIFRNNVVTGVTAALAVSILLPAVKKSGRPIAKSLIKGGMALYEASREKVAQAGETMEDLIAEVRAEEMEKQLAAANAAAASTVEDMASSGARSRPEASDRQQDLHAETTYTHAGGSRLSQVKTEAAPRYEEGGAAS